MTTARFRYLVRQALKIAGTLEDPNLVPSAFVRLIRAMIDEEYRKQPE